ncbi:MAG TPA: bacillithiol biosynthesis cysteine-adding enzyme BshC [Cyclobacteriaceae bacterium]|nr:bacillithiol biosynthesis cysteine-adding enzyme BshC [Cyclobacteriaceae bacterium]
MHLQKIPFRSTHSFTDFFLKYIEQDPALKPFYNHFPDLANFKKQVDEKSSFPDATRKVLVKTLRKQYDRLSARTGAVENNITSLLDNRTFTVVTGHQLNIFTGPLYFIYKIITVINTCRDLKKTYPDFNFVPVYWMASEDHDYEEIKSFRLYGQKYVWETKEQGAVGRFQTKAIRELLKSIPGEISVFADAYTQNDLLADAVRQYVNALFGEYGLVVVDADDRGLKKIFQPVIEADILQRTPFKLIEETNRKLETAGFHAPVHPREINFFYLDKGIRSRIEQKENGFAVVDTTIRFTDREIRKLIVAEPEKFSPNVTLRPLYQEMILPNLAYVGGPAELVYWMELKGVFDHFKTPFPMLMPRNFAMVVDVQSGRKISKSGLEIQDFFNEKNYLFNHWVAKNSLHDLSLGAAMKAMGELLKNIEERCAKLDATLVPMARAEGKRIQHAVEKVEKKMLRAEKRLHSDRLRQIESIKDQLFPNGSLQERTDNFLNFQQQDPAFVQKLVAQFDPLDFRFNILSYEP